jgi:RNA polymerase sigma-70 factor (ECF subfamily)
MDDQQSLSEGFEEHRSRLRAVAYRMLGSLSDADDAVQETWLRSTRADTSQVENLDAWLTTIVARVSLNMLRARQGRPEEPLGPRIPEPIVDPAEGTVPEHEALLADSVGLALLVVLQTLRPAERLAYVLHDMFDLSYDEIAPIVDRTPQAARQLASRARRRVRSAAPPQEGDLTGQREVVDAYITASREGDIDALIAVLHPDVLLRADGGRGRPGASVEVHGAAAVARRSQAFMRLGLRGRPALINGVPGAVYSRHGQLFSVLGFTVTAGRITEIDILADPYRLQQLDLSALDDPQQ